MTIDTLLPKVQAKADTLKEIGIQFVDKLETRTYPDFNVEKTLITAFIGALIAQGLIIVISWAKSKIDLRQKKKLLISDLKNQKGILLKLKDALHELNVKFENRDLNKHTVESFKYLKLDIFNSITKPELFKIFGKRIHDLLKIYKSIEFLKEYSVNRIYSDYISKLNIHLQEKKGNPDHEYYCSTHLGFIDIATSQLNNNTNTINELMDDISKFVK